MNAAYHLRKLDVMARRRVRNAFIAWWTLNLRISAAFTALSERLPCDRTADKCLYVIAAALPFLFAFGAFE